MVGVTENVYANIIRRGDKTLKTSVVEAEKRTNRAGIDSEVFELPSSSSVLEPDYADITKRLRLTSQPYFIYIHLVLVFLQV